VTDSKAAVPLRSSVFFVLLVTNSTEKSSLKDDSRFALPCVIAINEDEVTGVLSHVCVKVSARVAMMQARRPFCKLFDLCILGCSVVRRVVTHVQSLQKQKLCFCV